MAREAIADMSRYYPETLPDTCPERSVMEIRRLMRKDRKADAWHASERLWAICHRKAAGQISQSPYRWARSASNRADCLEDVRLNCMLAWIDLTDRHEFWQVRFYLCLQRAIHDAGDKYQRRNKQNSGFYTTDTAFTKIGSREELVVDVLGIATPDEISAVEVRLVAEAAAKSTPCEQPELLVRLIEEDASQEEMASQIGCSSRSIRNYIKKMRSFT